MRRIAIIDLGSNSFHLLITERINTESWKTIYKKRVVVQLGFSGNNSYGKISVKKMGEGLDVLKMFSEKIAEYNAEAHVYATSIFRDSGDSKIFLNLIFKELRFKVKVLSGDEESKLIFRGVKNNFDLRNKKVLILDIGGGSTELIISDQTKLMYNWSIDIGAVRLTDMFFKDEKIDRENIDSCKKYILTEIKSFLGFTRNEYFDEIIGCSGTSQTIARIMQARNKKSFKYLFSFNDIYYLTPKIQAQCDFIINIPHKNSLLTIPGLNKDRIEIITAGALILNTIIKSVNSKRFRISEAALKEGILLKKIGASESGSIKFT